jgi:hypothetical protein
MKDAFEIAVTGPELLGELDRAGLVDGVDHGFQRDGLKPNPVVGQVIVGDELIRVAAESGLDAAIQFWANRNADGAGGDTRVDGELSQHVLTPELLER